MPRFERPLSGRIGRSSPLPLFFLNLFLLLTTSLPDLSAQGGRPGAALLGLQGVAEGSMGGILIPARRSSDEIFGNPSSLPLLGVPGVALAWERHSPLRSSYRLSGSIPLGEFGAVAGGLLFDGISPIDYRNRDEQSIGTGSSGLILASVGGGIGIGPGAVGGTLHYISYSAADVDAGSSGIAVDFGASIGFRRRLFFGLVLNNLAGILNADYRTGLHEQLPTDIRITSSWRQPLGSVRTRVRRDPTGRVSDEELPPSTYVIAALEIRSASFDENPLYAAGVEVVPFTFDGENRVGARTGFNNRGEFGFGAFLDLPVEVGAHPTLSIGGRIGGEIEKSALHVGLEFRP